MDFDENIGGAALTLSAADITEIENITGKNAGDRPPLLSADAGNHQSLIAKAVVMRELSCLLAQAAQVIT